MTSSKRNHSFGWLDSVVRFLSAEWLLDLRPNGGTMVFVRSVFVAATFFLLASSISLLFYWDFRLCSLPSEARSTVLRIAPYAGAVFAFAYTALYARFASQWSYLANLYNQIMAVQSANLKCDEEAMNDWKVGFIQDALELHLATKPMFAEVIESILEDDKVQEAFTRGVSDGKEKLERLKSQLSGVRRKGG
jgi:hypothetical protein